MRLSGQQRRILQEALIGAFPYKSSLKQMLSFGLDKNLDAIAGGNNLQDIVFTVIEAAEAQGWVEDLVRAAREQNPGNPALKAIAQELLNPNPGKLQQEVEILRQEQEKLDDDLSSARNVDYTKLRDLLKAQQWEKADEETFAVMLKVAGKEEEGWLDAQCIEDFPCTDLRTIDQLWVKYSDGRFGFSVQKRILKSVGKNYEKFGEIVGWISPRRAKFDGIAAELILSAYSLLSVAKREWCDGHFPGGSLDVWSYSPGEWVEPPVSCLFSRIQTCEL
jgi:hypothetical protein